MAAGAGVGTTVAGPQRLDVVGVVDDAVDGHGGRQVVGRPRRAGAGHDVAGVADRDRRTGGHTRAAGIGPDIGEVHVGLQGEGRRVQAGAHRGHGLARLAAGGHRRQQRGRHAVDNRIRVQRRTAARAVATVAGAHLARPHLDPVEVGLQAAALGVDDGKRQRHVGRHLQAERTVGLDRRIAEDLHRLEFGLADRLAHAGHAGLRRDRPRGPHEARRCAAVGRVGGILDAHQVGDHRARVHRIAGRDPGDAGGAAGRPVDRGEHLLAHALEAVGVIDAAHFDQRQALGLQQGVAGAGRDRAGLGARLQRDRVGVHIAGRRRGDDQELLLGGVVHIDRVGWRHVVLHRVLGARGHRAVAVAEQVELGLAQAGAGRDDAVLRDLAGPVRHQDAVRAIPQRVGRGDAPEARQAAVLVERLQDGDFVLPALKRDRLVGRGVLLRVVGGVDLHQRAAFVGARQRHQRRQHEAPVRPARVHVARVQEAVAGAVRAVQHEHVGAVGLDGEDREAVALAHMLPAREHDVAVRAHHRVAVMALVDRDLRDRRALRVHRVKVEHALALVLVERVVRGAERLGLAGGLAVGREHEAGAGRQIGRVDVVVGGRVGEAPVAAAGETTGRHVVFPDVPVAGAGRAAIDRRGVGGGAAHRKHDLLAVVGDLGVGGIAHALRESRGEVVLCRAGR